MSLRAGDRNRLISFERATVVTDGFGGNTQSWSAVGSEWAEVVFGTGQERREAAQESGSAPATFRVLSNSVTAAVTVQDRIQFDGSAWDIISNVPLGRPGEGREITAVRQAD